MREELAAPTREILLDPKSVGRGLFDPKVLSQMVEEHQSGRRARGRELWMLFTIELWQRAYLDHFDARIDAADIEPGSEGSLRVS